MSHRSISTETLWNARRARRVAEGLRDSTWRKVKLNLMIGAGYAALFGATMAALRWLS